MVERVNMKSRVLRLRGRPIVSGRCQGLALVSMKPISFFGGVDSNSGRIIERGHDLEGINVKGKILCFPHGHGSTVGSYVLYALVKKGFGPIGMLVQEADTVVVAGAIIADIPMIDQIEITQISAGDEIEIDGSKGIVTITKTKANAPT